MVKAVEGALLGAGFRLTGLRQPGCPLDHSWTRPAQGVPRCPQPAAESWAGGAPGQPRGGISPFLHFSGFDNEMIVRILQEVIICSGVEPVGAQGPCPARAKTSEAAAKLPVSGSPGGPQGHGGTY